VTPRITRPASWQQDEGIVQPLSKDEDQLSRRLHQFAAPAFAGARVVGESMSTSPDPPLISLANYLDLTPRNGKYTPIQLERKSAFEAELLSIKANFNLNTEIWQS